MKLHSYGIFIFLLVNSCMLVGQDLSGKIITKSGDLIVDAYIQFKNSKSHTHTDSDGLFKVSDMALTDTMIIDAVGYKTLSFGINDLKVDQQNLIYMFPISINLESIIISPNIATQNLVTQIDINKNPVKSSQDIITSVPGLFIGQHAGGGKAEQIFLRGFDLDHGTDISLSMDGVPVNMTSHAHGQGYSDLHFIIPEVVEGLSFEKGLYNAQYGNFATAGYVNFQSRESLDHSSLTTEIGQFNSIRNSLLLNLLNKNNQSFYVAAEYKSSDGPFESPQNFNRKNIYSKYVKRFNSGDELTFSSSYFTSRWDASGQIPSRAVRNKSITRWGAIDDTEGGKTSRSNISLDLRNNISQNSTLKSQVWVSQYDFELFSNFTFFLDDPINGDQIKQKEKRLLFGTNTIWDLQFDYGDISSYTKAGLGFRNDYSNGNTLSHTLNKNTTLQRIQLGNITESNFFSHINHQISYNDWNLDLGIRYDYFYNQYLNLLSSSNTKQNINDGMLSPKLSLAYSPNKNLSAYFKIGSGFHSNDTRLAIFNKNTKLLTRANGIDLGFIYKPIPKMILDASLWILNLEDELVYVGDAGIVENSGNTNRKGIDLSMRYQIEESLYFQFDGNYAHARSVEDKDGENFIPLAPIFTSVASLSYEHRSGVYARFKYRYIGDRPANEDNTIVADGYFISDFNLGYKYKAVDFSVIVENVFNQKWNEAQFATESRLFDEPEAVEEIHFTPGTPFFVRGKISIDF